MWAGFVIRSCLDLGWAFFLVWRLVVVFVAGSVCWIFLRFMWARFILLGCRERVRVVCFCVFLLVCSLGGFVGPRGD